MPLVRIDAPHATERQLVALGEAVHESLIEAFDIPVDDRFQVLRGAPGDRVIYDPDFLGVHRDDGIVFVHVFLRSGRSEEKKQTFYRSLADRAPRAEIEPRNLFVVLTENSLADWSFGDGVAQYLNNPPD